MVPHSSPTNPVPCKPISKPKNLEGDSWLPVFWSSPKINLLKTSYTISNERNLTYRNTGVYLQGQSSTPTKNTFRQNILIRRFHKCTRSILELVVPFYPYIHVWRFIKQSFQRLGVLRGGPSLLDLFGGWRCVERVYTSFLRTDEKLRVSFTFLH